MTAENTKIPRKGARGVVPKKQGWRTFWGVLLMLAWAIASIIASQLVVGWTMIWMMGVEGFSQPMAQAIYNALSYILAMGMIIWVPTNMEIKWETIEGTGKKKVRVSGRKTSGTTREILGLQGWPTWTDIGLAPVGFIVSLILAAGLVYVFSLFPWFDAGQAQAVGFDYSVVGAERLIAFVALVVIAPIAEEIIFRGWIYGKLREKASIVPAALLTSLVFGIVHMQWNVGVNVFAMSLVLCALREITGTVYAGILVHMIKNGVAFYLLYVLGVM